MLFAIFPLISRRRCVTSKPSRTRRKQLSMQRPANAPRFQGRQPRRLDHRPAVRHPACTKCQSQTYRARCNLRAHSGSCICVNASIVQGALLVTWKPIGHAVMANRAVLTVAAICTATWRRQTRSPNAGLRRVRMIRCGSRKPRQPNRLRRSGRRLPAIALISPRTIIGIGHASDETSVRAVHHCSSRLRTFSITVSNPARNVVASAKSSVERWRRAGP